MPSQESSPNKLVTIGFLYENEEVFPELSNLLTRPKTTSYFPTASMGLVYLPLLAYIYHKSQQNVDGMMPLLPFYRPWN